MSIIIKHKKPFRSVAQEERLSSEEKRCNTLTQEEEHSKLVIIFIFDQNIGVSSP